MGAFALLVASPAHATQLRGKRTTAGISSPALERHRPTPAQRKAFGHALRTLRNGEHQGRTARRLGLSRRTLVRLEGGKVAPHIVTLATLSKGYGVEPAVLSKHVGPPPGRTIGTRLRFQRWRRARTATQVAQNGRLPESVVDAIEKEMVTPSQADMHALVRGLPGVTLKELLGRKRLENLPRIRAYPPPDATAVVRRPKLVDTYTERFRAYVKRARQERAWLQRELAAAVARELGEPLTRESISAYECGKRVPRPGTLRALDRALGAGGKLQAILMPPRGQSFPNRLAHYRLKAGLTWQQIADRLRVTGGAVGQWENGRQRPRSADMMEDLARVLGTTVHELDP